MINRTFPYSPNAAFGEFKRWGQVDMLDWRTMLPMGRGHHRPYRVFNHGEPRRCRNLVFIGLREYH